MPAWFYNKNGARLFADNEVVPSGYVDSPAKVDYHKTENTELESMTHDFDGEVKRRGRPKKIEG